MAIDFKPKMFGATSSPAAQEDRPRAEFWINLGYESDVENDEGKKIFISLPQGLALDTQEHLPANMSNAQFAAMRSAQNDLLDQLVAHAGATLQPGEDTIITLQVQLRRVKAPAAPINPENNPLAKKLSF